jgi:2'-5' RNA ligase
LKDRLRTFVAVELAPEVRDRVAREVERLRACGGNVRWTPPGNVHLTLKFLGDTDRHLVPEVLRRLEGSARGTEPFTMELRGLAFFPKPVKPRIVACGVDEEAERALAALASRIDEAVSPLGFKKDERAFRGHVTLGRVRSPKGIKTLSDYLLTREGAPVGSQEVDSVALVMSELKRGGPVYTVLGHAPLGGRESYSLRR